MQQSIGQQLRANVVALTSLAVALTALGYNTWRNERTEHNRNIRVAAFEVLKQLGELQVVVNSAVYGKEGSRMDPMAGWGRVALITDLSQLLPAPAPHREQSGERVTIEIDQSRAAIREILRGLR